MDVRKPPKDSAQVLDSHNQQINISAPTGAQPLLAPSVVVGRGNKRCAAANLLRVVLGRASPRLLT